MQPSRIVTPKSFYIKERDEFYSDWLISFFRELFQNSTDERAKNIRIWISDEAGQGSFGRDPAVKQVTRVIFEDDGGGMSQDVLDKVYFAPGQSTKTDGATTGGYGRARLMTCFSQVRYRIRTQDRVVEGDGPEYTNLSVDDHLRTVEAYVAATERELSDAKAANNEAQVKQKEDKLAVLRAEIEALNAGERYFKGCRLEIDLDPNQYESWRSNRPTVERMTEKLDQYMKQSQIQSNVFLNGDELTVGLRRGAVRRKLTVPMDDSEIPASWREPKSGIEFEPGQNGKTNVVFATVHLTNTDTAQYKGKMVVRVRGAAMYVKSTKAPQQVILEISPTLSRSVLTSNRDGIRDPYDGAVQSYLDMLATDANKALEDDSDKEFQMIDGGLGAIKAVRPEHQINYETATNDFDQKLISAVSAVAATASPGALYTTEEAYQAYGFAGAPYKAVEKLLSIIRDQGAEFTFLRSYHDQEAVRAFEQRIRNYGKTAALEDIGRDLALHLASVLVIRQREAEEAWRKKLGFMNQMHNFPVRRETLTPENPDMSEEDKKKARRNLTNSIWRNTPTNWKPEEGKGSQPRKLVAAWIVAVDAVIRKYLDLYPNQDEFQWTAGFYFSQPKWQYNYRLESRGPVVTRAMCEKREGNFIFYLNPLNEDCNKLAYNLSSVDDKDSLITLAIHEVSHIQSMYHDEGFTTVQTELQQAFGINARKKLQKDMDTAVKAAAAAFAGGKSRIQKMDDEDGTRPSDKLLALVSSNFKEAASKNLDGTITVDTDHLTSESAELEDEGNELKAAGVRM